VLVLAAVLSAQSGCANCCGQNRTAAPAAAETTQPSG